jgi:hypothetical protein
MADQAELADVLRRALDASVQYYTTMGRLAAEGLQTLLGSLASVSSGQQPEATTEQANATEAAPVSTIVLEAEAGGRAMGVFLVENALSHEVSAPIVISALADSAGREVHPPLKFEPEVIKLEPKEQVLVRIIVAIDESFEPDVRYRGQISVPDLPGTRVPLVLRRRATATAATPPGARAKSRGKGRVSKPSRGRATG